MRKILKIVLLSLLPICSMAQSSFPDSVRLVLHNAKSNSVRYLANMELGYYYSEDNRDSSLLYYENAFSIAVKNKHKLAEASSLSMLGYQTSMTGEYSRSLQFLLDAFTRIEESRKDEEKWIFSPGFKATAANYKDAVLARNQGIYSALMRNTENVEQELLYLKESIITAKKIDYRYRIAVSDLNLSGAYLKLNKPDSALIFGTEGLRYIRQTDEKKYESALLIVLGDIYLKKGNKQLSKQYYYDGMQSAQLNNASSHLCWANFALCKYYLEEKNIDSSLFYANKTLELYFSAATPSHIFTVGDVYENLFESYQLRNEFDSAYKYQGLTRLSNDSIYKDRIKRLAAFQNMGFEEQMRLKDIEKQKLSYQSKIRTYAMLAGIGIFMLIAFLLYRNNRNSRKANTQLQKQKDEIEQQKKNVEETLADLKSTQSQLIQSEKMASLGELTAGIAHEIQNPLNFVNNFSEVNKELLEEMREEIASKNFEEVSDIAKDVIENEQKISHHGKRAEAIVKGMLQHSRTSSGQKEPTDINALADEYLRLSYHGMRAKDKSLPTGQAGFNADFKTEFDETLPKINVIPQDIGRVLLNLINNAFYACAERSRSAVTAPLPPSADGGFQETQTDYKPLVIVRTGSYLPPSGGMRGAFISVSDNGSGIPDSIKDKIFQPFFTTKPTGSGTGLGLSLSYDIVKAHGGELKMETKEGEGLPAGQAGTEFIILLPTSNP